VGYYTNDFYSQTKKEKTLFFFLGRVGPRVTSFYKLITCNNPINTYISFRKDNMETEQLKRIADALEEVLRLVKEDQQRTKQYLEKEKS
jgi:hypothetical protein